MVAFARKHLGVDLYPVQAQALDAWEASGKRKALFCWGRRSGKDICAAVVAIYNATVPDLSAYLRPGERRYILVVATQKEQAAGFCGTVRELVANAPDADLRSLIDESASTADQIVFTTGVTLRALPCSSRSTRGMAASLVIFNELAHFLNETEGYQAGRAVYRALTPSTATFLDQARIVAISTPLWPSGIFHDLFKAGQSGADRDLFTSQAATWTVNPRVTRESLDAEFLADPESARVEYGAEFLGGVGAFLEAAAVLGCMISGRRQLPPVPGVRYVAACDPAFARGGDAFSFAIGHAVGRGEQASFVIDLLEAWRGRNAPLNSDVVLDEIADLAKEYHVAEVISDQFAVVPIADGMRRRGVMLWAQPLTAELKADIMTALKRALNLGKVELPDDRALANELVNLEIRSSPSGKPRIAGARGTRDDLAMAVATVVHRLARHAGAGSSRLQQGFARAALAAANRSRPPVVDAAWEPSRSGSGRESWFGSSGDSGWPS